MRQGTCGAVMVEGQNIPEAWERSIIATLERGQRRETEYDREGDVPSHDVTMVIRVEDPFSEPRIHRNFPGTVHDLVTYEREIVDGIHDDRVKEGGWPYSYHQRLASFGGKIDQLSLALERIARSEYTRRAQAITWDPFQDPHSDEPPCLQRIWLRTYLVSRHSNQLMLNMNTHWRSRDGYKAAFMNIYALTALQRRLAERLSEIIDNRVLVGSYIDISDSYHIYGKDEAEAKRFVASFERRPFEARAWTQEQFHKFLSQGSTQK